ncbi:hypothetical protein COEREDRAFT_89926 [Coemansia reversa NRRL 1564]|uniref:Uncharacterized protein n=1 Tax=Coemansia reversa (strain ATCC 12441 / NRRL 1564) TaxID=763665 RepID=A0A2G5B2L9_COERN|nr:hypothetical protein COEREDRAFT_89926 [Coemansia reversa NRRL 1564]|eukprot:PIA12957.1 hypothetical protein COEREDRAFT_89926 [Coemansia reversa NRRL 1564]
MQMMTAQSSALEKQNATLNMLLDEQRRDREEQRRDREEQRRDREILNTALKSLTDSQQQILARIDGLPASTENLLISADFMNIFGSPTKPSKGPSSGQVTSHHSTPFNSSIGLSRRGREGYKEFGEALRDKTVERRLELILKSLGDS